MPWRDKKYGYWSLVDGRCWLVKKTKLRQDKNVNCIEDYHFTALNLKTFGGVVVNNWVLTDCVRYGAGSYGSLKKRMPQKIKESKQNLKLTVGKRTMSQQFYGKGGLGGPKMSFSNHTSYQNEVSTRFQLVHEEITIDERII